MSLSTYQNDQEHHLVDRERFRCVISRFASGVVILTARSDGIDYGLTASAISSLSLDPPMLLACVNKTANTHKAIAQSQIFGVNILREDQSELARHFARSHQDKFQEVSILYGDLGAPLLRDALAVLECHVVEEVTGGTHSIFLAEVHSARAAEGLPLAYFRGRMGRFEFTGSVETASLWSKMQWQD